LNILTHSRESMIKLDALFQQEKFADAIVLCDELVKLMPDVTHVHAYRAYTLGQLKRVKESIAEYELAVRDGYPTGVVYYNLALLLENGKKYQRALEMYLAGFELDPGLVNARSQAFELALGLHQYPLALRLGKAMLEANPMDSALRTRVTRLEMIDGAKRN
jgi:tetratricopeptide (TPR) repeat protein